MNVRFQTQFGSGGRMAGLSFVFVWYVTLR
jgi:hypothetical protein